MPLFDDGMFDGPEMFDTSLRAYTYVTVDGIERGYGRADDNAFIFDLNVEETLTMTPNTARFSAKGFAPSPGDRVIVQFDNASNPDRLFAGTVLTVDTAYIGSPSNPNFVAECVDDTYLLNRLKVTGQYSGAISTIAASLVSTYAPTFTITVEAGLGNLDLITFTQVDLWAALNQLAKRFGGYVTCGQFSDIYLFITPTVATGSIPTPLTSTHPSLEAFSSRLDLTQFVTRVFVEGGGPNALAQCAPGETILPVVDASWFNVAGGIVVSGPQKITYTTFQAGGGGSLVGSGAQPATATTLTLASGSGVETGAHSYGVTFVTAAGESIASPLSMITVGVLGAPSSGCTAGSPTIGSGVTTGDHYYAITFVNSAGETTASPLSGTITTGPVTTGLITAPASAPTTAAPSSGGSIDVGNHDYAVTFINGAGETTGGPTTTRNVPAFDIPGGFGGVMTWNGTTGNLVGDAFQGFLYSVTYTTSAGETTGNGGVSTVYIPIVQTSGGFAVNTPTSGGSIDPGTHFYAYTLQTASGETANLGGSNTSITAPNQTVPLGRPSTGDARVTHWNIYRSKAGTSSPYYLVASVAIGTSTYNDTMSDASLPATTIPTVDTASTGQFNLVGIPTGPTGTTGRKIYRTILGGSQLKLVATIGDNSTTTYTDNVADGSLGANIPTTNTATINKTIALSSIPLGGTGTTGRRVYRTTAGGAQLKLVATISNNSATTYNDTMADGSLGANIPTSNTTATTSDFNVVPLSGIPLGPPLVTARKIYRTAAGGSQLKLVATLADNTTTIYSDTVADGSLGANIPTTNTAAANRVNLSAIQAGVATVTARKLYRTVAAGSQLKLLATLADNTTTIYADLIADASLGANVPTTDTSALPQPQGQVLAGSTSCPVAYWGSNPTAGWAVIGNGSQVIRYTGVTGGNTLTGVPATGPGSLTSSIQYGASITAAPQLLGVPASGTGSILYTILKGDPVNLFVTVNDVAAQTVLAALVGGDGIQEYFIQDRRLSALEATARGLAHLALRGSLDQSIKWQSRDFNTRAGRVIDVDLPTPFNINDEFKIQRATYRDFTPELFPTISAVGSTTLYSFEDLLRSARTVLNGGG